MVKRELFYVQVSLMVWSGDGTREIIIFSSVCLARDEKEAEKKALSILDFPLDGEEFGVAGKISRDEVEVYVRQVEKEASWFEGELTKKGR